jgi:hypothetical protein
MRTDMRPERISRWILALIVAAAAATKVVRAQATGRAIAAMLTAAGLGPLPQAGIDAAVWGLAASEFLLAAFVALSPRPRIGLAALLALISAGILLFGAATSWGRDAELACPCGLPFELSVLHNTFAAMLVRDAILVALVALAWPKAARAATDLGAEGGASGSRAAL